MTLATPAVTPAGLRAGHFARREPFMQLALPTDLAIRIGLHMLQTLGMPHS